MDRNYIKSFTLGLAALLLALPGFAATFVVTNLNDGGEGSLRAAVAMTNDGDLVGFSAGLSGTIDLTSGMIRIDKSIHIDGTGITINSAKRSRAFYIRDVREVKLTGFTFRKNTAESGGAIYVKKSKLTITDARFLDNKATGAAADMGGGAIYATDESYVTIGDTYFEGNVAVGEKGSGGAIFSGEGVQLHIYRSTLKRNFSKRAGGAIEDAMGGSISLFQVDGTQNFSGVTDSTGNPGNGGFLHVTGDASVMVTQGRYTENYSSAEGGAFWNGSGKMSFDKVLLADNYTNGADADQGGGAVFNQGGSVLATNQSRFLRNAAQGAKGSGGALFNAEGGTVEVYNSTFANNTSSRAGGAIEDASNSELAVQLFNVTGESNDAGSSPGNGGFLHVSGTGNVNVHGGYFNENLATEGGAFWNGMGTLLTNSASMAMNIADGDDADQGGGAIFNMGGTIDIRNADISGNMATGAKGSGGGIFNAEGGSAILNNVVLTNNSAMRAGGGVEDASNTSLDVIRGRFDNNYAGMAPGNGGGIHITGTASLKVFGTKFNGNEAATEGGAIWNGKGSASIAAEFNDNLAHGDDADQGGGAIFNLAGDLAVYNSEFYNNEADGEKGSGGAVLLDTTATPVQIAFTNATFVGNKASRAGGAIEDRSFQGGNDVTQIFMSRFFDNVTGSAPGNGGAIHISGTGDMTVNQSEFKGNIAANEGGALWNSVGQMVIAKSVVDSNAANGATPMNGGGGVFNNGGTIYMSASSIVRNTITGVNAIGGGFHNGAGSTAFIEASTISSNTSAFNAAGIANAGTMSINASTIALNEAANNGGGIGQAPTATSVTLGSTVIAYNVGPNRGSQVDIAGDAAYLSAGYNLLASDDAGWFSPTSTDKEGTTDAPIDPLLGALESVMGFPVHTPRCGSPVIDMGDPRLNRDDQLGDAAVGTRDIGAVEFTDPNCEATDDLAAATAPDFKLYPTVNNGNSISVQLEEDVAGELVTVQVLDAGGVVVQTARTASVSTEFALPGLTPGNYFLRVISQDAAQTKSFIVTQ